MQVQPKHQKGVLSIFINLFTRKPGCNYLFSLWNSNNTPQWTKRHRRVVSTLFIGDLIAPPPEYSQYLKETQVYLYATSILKCELKVSIIHAQAKATTNLLLHCLESFSPLMSSASNSVPSIVCPPTAFYLLHTSTPFLPSLSLPPLPLLEFFLTVDVTLYESFK